MIAITGTEVPAVFVYGGTIAPGYRNGQKLDIVSVFEGVGKHNNGDNTDQELHGIECSACPGSGSCGGMYTANTMASAVEAMGMSLPGSSSNPAESKDKYEDVEREGETVCKLLEGVFIQKIL